jgi:uncharacterized membrane protein YfcA
VYLVPTRRRTGARLLPCALPSCVAAIAGSAAGWVIAKHYGATVMSVVAASTTGFGVFTLLLLVIGRDPLRATAQTSRSMLESLRRPVASDRG